MSLADTLAKVTQANGLPTQQPKLTGLAASLAAKTSQAQTQPSGVQESPKPLPPGAIDFLPNGEAYYGEGVQGWLRGASARMGEQSYRKNADGTYSPSATTGLQMAARGIKEGIGGLLAGATGIQENAQAALMTAPAQTLEDLADKSNSYLPDFNKGEVMRNWVNWIPGMSIVGAAYNSARILTGSRKLAWEDVKQTWDGNAEMGSRLIGSSILDANLRSEFLRRFNAGEKADYLVAELANPFAELAVDLVADPFNAVGFVIDDAVKAAQLAKATKRFDTVEELASGWKAIRNVAGTAEEAPVLADMATSVLKLNAQAAAALTDTKDLIKPWRVSARGRADQAADVVGNTFKVMLAAFKNNPDDMGEALRAMALVGSNDAEMVKQGLGAWSRINAGLGEVATSQEGLQTSQFLSRLLIDETGNLNGKFIEDVVDAAKSGDMAGMIEKWDKVSNKVLGDMYPTVLEMAAQPDKYNVPGWAKAVAATHEKLQVDWKIRNLNGKFSTMYISLNPGAGFRNLMNNVFTAAVDFGPKAALEATSGSVVSMAGKVNPGIAKIEELLGFLPSSATRGLRGGASGPLEDGHNIIKAIGNLTEKGEEGTSIAVTYASLKRSLGKSLKEGVAIAPLEVPGLSREHVDRLIGLTRKFSGDADKAIQVWMGEAKAGVIDTFRDIRSLLNAGDIHKLEETGDVMADINKVLEAPTQENAIAAIKSIRDSWAKKAAQADGFLPGIDATTEIGAEVAEAQARGMSAGAANEFNVKLTYQRAAAKDINDAADKVVGNLVREANDPVLRSSLVDIQQEMKATKDTITGAANHDKMRTAVREIVKGDPAKAEFQAASVLEGYPAFRAEHTDLGSIDSIWQYYFKTKNDKYAEMLNKYQLAWADLFEQKVNPLVGMNVLDDPAFQIARENVDQAMQVIKADLIDKTGAYIDPVKFWLDQKRPDTAIALMAKRDYGIATAGEQGVGNKQLLNTINANLPEGAVKYNSLKEVDFATAQEALKAHAAKKVTTTGTEAAQVASKLEKVQPPLIAGQMPTSAQAHRANQAGLNGVLDRLEAGINGRWGKGSAIPDVTPEQLAAVGEWQKETIARVTKARAIAARVAQKERDFALLNYGQKTSMDHALAYIMPYQFWYNRSYQNWMVRLAEHPEIISKYANYRQWLEQEHANLPDWWKYNVSINDLPGVNVDNPMYMNLEATLNPLNGLTGIDFNDQNKIVGEQGTFENFWTQTLNDIGKFGPSVWTPLTMATAGYLYLNGERDAAQRWGGRLIPQTAAVKALASMAGKNLELDPVVQLLSGGTGADAYETRRIGRAIYQMAYDGTITKEQAIETARTQQGPVWEQARLIATQNRAPGQLLSFFGGVGFKGRSASDMSIDKFYEDYNALWKNSDNLSPQEFRIAMDGVREKYPFMDTVLLSKQGGIDRDRAYSYNVLGRIAPGDSKAIITAAGLAPDIMDKFYAEKGKIGAWAESDRLKFMGAMVSIGTSLAIPPTATQQEWTQAKNAYTDLSNQIAGVLGADIWDKVDVWYSLPNPTQKDLYIKQHPEVGQAMDFKAYQVANTPILAAYYNGLANIEQYYKGEMVKDVKAKLGADYYDILKERETILDPIELKRYDAKHPQLKKFSKLSEQWTQVINRKLAEYAKSLPVGQSSFMQNVPLTSTGQQAIAAAIQTQNTPAVQWQDIQGGIPTVLQNALYRYFAANKPLTAAEKSTLTRTAKFLGLTSDQIMQAAASATVQ